MNATEELRRLLNEHGIEWWSDRDIWSGHTQWSTDDAAFTSLAMDGDALAIEIISTMTPEQAIAATVGGETCHVKAVKKMGDLFGFSLSCGHSMVNPFNDHPDYCPWCGRKVVE